MKRRPRMGDYAANYRGEPGARRALVRIWLARLLLPRGWGVLDGRNVPTGYAGPPRAMSPGTAEFFGLDRPT